MVKSPRLSFKGYRIQEALYRNKEAIKSVLAIILGANFFAGFDLQVFLLSLGAATVALAGKLIQDAFDYYMTEVEL